MALSSHLASPCQRKSLGQVPVRCTVHPQLCAFGDRVRRMTSDVIPQIPPAFCLRQSFSSAWNFITQARLAGHLDPEGSCFCLLPCCPLNHKRVPLHPVLFFVFFVFLTRSTHILRSGRNISNLHPCKPLCGLRLVSTYVSPCEC